MPPDGAFLTQNPGAGNGIFGSRDRRPKIRPRHHYCRQRPGALKIGGKIPAETASFRSTTVSAVREDWVVVCAVRYEPVSLLLAQYQGDFREKQRADYEKSKTCPQTLGFSLSRRIREQGETGSIDRRQQGDEFVFSLEKPEILLLAGCPLSRFGFGGQSGQVRQLMQTQFE